jgi:short-subunit dehydrogenase
MKSAHARVLLTGANGGIGQAAAVALAEAGAALMLAGRSPARLAGLARSLPGEVQWQQADLESEASIAGLAAAAAQWNCNVVVHCAGAASFGCFEDIAPAEVRQVMQTNLLAPIALTQALLAHLRGCEQARVLFVGSVLGAIGLPGHSIYSASKFGLRGFAQALGRELGDTTVRVQYLGPRSTRTAFNSAAVEAYNEATGSAMDTPERVAAELVALLRSGASERFLGFPEALAVRLNGLAPALLDPAFARHRRSLPDVTAARLPAASAGSAAPRGSLPQS